MSTNKVNKQSHPSGESTSSWSGEARETWVSLAIAAATASLRGASPAANDTSLDANPEV